MVSKSAHVDHVPEDLQRSWIEQLRWFFELFNFEYANDLLKPPLFRLSFSGDRLGSWDPNTRTITISVRHILEQSWESVLDTLRHEMAHQYVHEVLNMPNVPPHGDAFREACRRLRCDPRAHAARESVVDLEQSAADRDRNLMRVKELLALAGSPNEHEAANAMRMAQRYLLKYNLSLGEVRHSPQRYLSRSLGTCKARIQEYEYILGGILQRHFFVLVIWTFSYDPGRDRRGRTLQVSGTLANVEMAEHVYRYVMGLTESLWREHKRARNSSRGTKLQYLSGLLRGLDAKLDLAQSDLTEEFGIVWRGDPALKEYYKYLYPKTSSFRPGGVSRNDGFYKGYNDGKKINIHRPVEGGSSGVTRSLTYSRRER